MGTTLPTPNQKEGEKKTRGHDPKVAREGLKVWKRYVTLHSDEI